MGVNDLEIDRLDISINYHIPSRGAEVQVQAGVGGLIRILADADIDHFSFRMNFATEKGGACRAAERGAFADRRSWAGQAHGRGAAAGNTRSRQGIRDGTRDRYWNDRWAEYCAK